MWKPLTLRSKVTSARKLKVSAPSLVGSCEVLSLPFDARSERSMSSLSELCARIVSFPAT